MECKDRFTLEVLAEKYGTDKLQHGYIPFYVKNLPEKPKRILEIGVKEGRSLAMWAEYFPDAEIRGLDLFAEISANDVMKNVFDLYPPIISRAVLHTGNQCDYLSLEQLRKLDFDVIIDDGSHNSRDQLITFFGLFNGKHYFIEDLHCNYEEFYSQGMPVGLTARTVFNDLKIIYDGYSEEKTRITFNPGDKIVCIAPF